MGLKTFSYQFGTEMRKERGLIRAYVEIIKPFLKNITNRQADVLSELLYWNLIKSSIPDKKDRFKVIMGSEVREAIEAELNISTAVYRNALTGLRAKKILDKDNTVKDSLLVTLTEGRLSITFNFRVDE